MANNIPEVAPVSHIPMSTLWDRQKELFRQDQCYALLFSARIDFKYYQAAKEKEQDVVNLGDGSERFFKSLRQNHYWWPLLHLLRVEQAYQVLETRRYDLHNVKLRMEADRLLIQYPGLTTNGLSVCPGDQIVIQHSDSCYHLEFVNRIKGDTIWTAPMGSQPDCFIKGGKFTVMFNPRGVPTHRCVEAIKYFGYPNNRRLFQEMLFHDEDFALLQDRVRKTQAKIIIEANQDKKKSKNKKNQQDKLDESTTRLLNQRLDSCNEAQRAAITNILAGRCRPKPYILFGPPGTGKTFTLVESVIQIHLRRPELEILVCVSSNACVNHIAELLYNSGVFEGETLRRLMPEQRLEDLVENHLDKEYHTDNISSGKVVVTTNVKAGNIKRRFDFVFVDEAGHAIEPEALIGATKLKPDGVFVLSGDPKQLRPVITNSNVAKFCLKFSMLERLYKFKLYSEKRDINFITILNESYRADERLMALWSNLFYEGRIVGKGPPTPQALLDLFNLRDNPIAFRHNLSEEASLTISRSRWNEGEVEVCLNLIRKLRKQVRPDQIGVISMYKLQAKRIQKALLDELYKAGKSRPMNGNAGLKGKGQSNKKKKQQQPIQPDDTSPEKYWLEFERKVVDMKHSWGRKQKMANTVVLSNRPAGSPEPIQTTTTIDDLPLLIDTVDAFQGNEREVIIISTVRSPGIESFKFIHDPRRFNVAISRAKWLLITIGNRDVLKGGLHWRGYLNVAKNI